MKARIRQGSGDACVPAARRHLQRQRAASGALLCSTASGERWQRSGDTTAKRGPIIYLEKWPS
ncbi:hypothetical protein F441_01635 [Phytophthora nicotianae CJ01A1]|uniref:Uncharacterized protein n=1 Tax=Phytophthora nicotianae CJ01A1 TaxID=1317063 RepID=W2XSJ2_PHYNI|nr:hypothetical protein F441_01635 [Phytophthora nicotianae CJ01A1]